MCCPLQKARRRGQSPARRGREPVRVVANRPSIRMRASASQTQMPPDSIASSPKIAASAAKRARERPLARRSRREMAKGAASPGTRRPAMKTAATRSGLPVWWKTTTDRASRQPVADSVDDVGRPEAPEGAKTEAAGGVVSSDGETNRGRPKPPAVRQRCVPRTTAPGACPTCGRRSGPAWSGRRSGRPACSAWRSGPASPAGARGRHGAGRGAAVAGIWRRRSRLGRVAKPQCM